MGAWNSRATYRRWALTLKVHSHANHRIIKICGTYKLSYMYMYTVPLPHAHTHTHMHTHTNPGTHARMHTHTRRNPYHLPLHANRVPLHVLNSNPLTAKATKSGQKCFIVSTHSHIHVHVHRTATSKHAPLLLDARKKLMLRVNVGRDNSSHTYQLSVQCMTS